MRWGNATAQCCCFLACSSYDRFLCLFLCCHGHKRAFCQTFFNLRQVTKSRGNWATDFATLRAAAGRPALLRPACCWAYIRCIVVLAQLSSKPYFLRHNFCGSMSKVGPNLPAYLAAATAGAARRRRLMPLSGGAACLVALLRRMGLALQRRQYSHSKLQVCYSKWWQSIKGK